MAVLRRDRADQFFQFGILHTLRGEHQFPVLRAEFHGRPISQTQRSHGVLWQTDGEAVSPTRDFCLHGDTCIYTRRLVHVQKLVRVEQHVAEVDECGLFRIELRRLENARLDVERV
jgi:hypothetical protein